MKKKQKRKGSGKTSGKTAKKTGRKAAAKKSAAKKSAAKKSSRASGNAGGGVDMESIERLVRFMDKNNLLEVEVLSGPDQKIRLSRRATDSPSVVYSAPSSAETASASPSASNEAGAGSDSSDNEEEFASPMVGTFYRAANPESDPYVTTGDRVGEDTVICIVEAMKVMNEIKAETKGEIIDILVENGEAIEYGQPLFLIRKSS